jgi:hypothetical protein
MRFKVFVLFIFSNLNGYSQAIDSLLAKYDVIVNNEKHTINYISPKEVLYEFKVSMTILNSEGDDYSSFSLRYDKFREIKDIEGSLFDKNGKKIKTIKNKDINDIAQFDGMNVAVDARYKNIKFNYAEYPYTMEISYSKKYLSTFYLPTVFLNYPSKAVVKNFALEYNLPIGLKYQLFKKNINKEFKTRIEGIREIITLDDSNLMPIESMKDSSEDKKLSYVKFRVENISYGPYQSEIRSWDDFGKFILELNRDRDALSAEEINRVQSLTSKYTNVKDKIDATYKYMQARTRYISVQLGIGGHQPIPASEVSKNGYGDCKGLSNYMYSLLKCIGIKSNYILIDAGKENIEKIYQDSFVESDFNHAILAVPLPSEKDTIWLECTSQTSPSNYMGTFTGNRQALWLDNEECKFVRTKSLSSEDNKRIIKAIVNIDESGNAMIVCNNIYTNQEYEAFSEIKQYSLDDRKEYLNQVFDIPSYEVIQDDHSFDFVNDVKVNQDLKIMAPYYATIQGNRIFIIPNIFSKLKSRLNSKEIKTLDFNLNSERTEIDSITISIPDNYKIETIPKSLTINNDFGSYAVNTIVKENKIIYTRSLLYKGKKHGKEQYQNYVRYIDQIYNSDKAKIVLVKS